MIYAPLDPELRGYLREFAFFIGNGSLKPTDEEGMLVLGLRSDLQAIAYFLPPEYTDKLLALDPLLSDSIRLNAKVYDECRRQKLDIEKYIPAYWWWHGCRNPTNHTGVSSVDY